MLLQLQFNANLKLVDTSTAGEGCQQGVKQRQTDRNSKANYFSFPQDNGVREEIMMSQANQHEDGPHNRRKATCDPRKAAVIRPRPFIHNWEWGRFWFWKDLSPRASFFLLWLRFDCAWLIPNNFCRVKFICWTWCGWSLRKLKERSGFGS